MQRRNKHGKQALARRRARRRAAFEIGLAHELISLTAPLAGAIARAIPLLPQAQEPATDAPKET